MVALKNVESDLKFIALCALPTDEGSIPRWDPEG